MVHSTDIRGGGVDSFKLPNHVDHYWVHCGPPVVFGRLKSLGLAETTLWIEAVIFISCTQSESKTVGLCQTKLSIVIMSSWSAGSKIYQPPFVVH
jgi:hypothetical protein